jgi:hypothetical protein
MEARSVQLGGTTSPFYFHPLIESGEAPIPMQVEGESKKRKLEGTKEKINNLFKEIFAFANDCLEPSKEDDSGIKLENLTALLDNFEKFQKLIKPLEEAQVQESELRKKRRFLTEQNSSQSIVIDESNFKEKLDMLKTFCEVEVPNEEQLKTIEQLYLAICDYVRKLKQPLSIQIVSEIDQLVGVKIDHCFYFNLNDEESVKITKLQVANSQSHFFVTLFFGGFGTAEASSTNPYPISSCPAHIFVHISGFIKDAENYQLPDMPMDQLEELLKNALFYGSPDLIEKCEYKYSEGVNATNAFAAYELANELNLPVLREAALNQMKGISYSLKRPEEIVIKKEFFEYQAVPPFPFKRLDMFDCAFYKNRVEILATAFPETTHLVLSLSKSTASALQSISLKCFPKLEYIIFPTNLIKEGELNILGMKEFTDAISSYKIGFLQVTQGRRDRSIFKEATFDLLSSIFSSIVRIDFLEDYLIDADEFTRRWKYRLSKLPNLEELSVRTRYNSLDISQFDIPSLCPKLKKISMGCLNLKNLSILFNMTQVLKDLKRIDLLRIDYEAQTSKSGNDHLIELILQAPEDFVFYCKDVYLKGQVDLYTLRASPEAKAKIARTCRFK